MVGQRAARRRQPEPDVEAAERQALDQALDLRELGALGAQELAARRHVEEQVAHLDRRAGRVRFRRRAAQHAVERRHRGRERRVRGPRDHLHPRNRGDARQRLAAEPERAHRLEVLDAADLAGGMAGERERQLGGRDAGPVVTHPDQLGAAALDLDLDRTRAGVEAVLDQFLDHRRRALDHLAGRDLVDELLGQDTDGHRGSRGRGAARIAEAGAGPPDPGVAAIASNRIWPSTRRRLSARPASAQCRRRRAGARRSRRPWCPAAAFRRSTSSRRRGSPRRSAAARTGHATGVRRRHWR